jgi:DNA-directed RNA polymerase sigma subunit (sigma70/sigma32)
MPFTAKPIEPGGQEAVERAVAAHQAMQRLTDEKAVQAQLRVEAIHEARARGVSLDAIAERLGVSRERVRQIASGK